MREVKLQLSLNQTQKVRLQSALQTLEDLSSTSTVSSVTVADTIPLTNEDGNLELHGTLELNGEVVATLCGVVERGNKLVYVRSLRARYEPKVEDIIVGRVLEIAPKRWRLEINFSQDAVLMLSSMNFPDGIQRRRTAVDELNMRSIFKENDVCAEVHGCQHDGSLQLRVRSQKYGKLENGQLLSVPAYLVKQCKHHFHHLNKYGVDLIIGCNGFIWVGEQVEVRENTMLDDHESKELEQRVMPLEIRHNICRIANSVRLLSALGFTLSLEVIASTVEASLSTNVAIKDMLEAEFCVVTAEREVQRRTSKRKKRRIFV